MDESTIESPVAEELEPRDPPASSAAYFKRLKESQPPLPPVPDELQPK